MQGRGARAKRTRVVVPLALSLGLLGAALPCTAQAMEPDGSELSRAHDAYARGAAAYAHGDYATASREFAAADALVPDPLTLRVALEAATLADDAVLGTELVLRAARGPVDAPLAHTVSVATTRFAHRTGRIVIHCASCLGMIDGAPTQPGVPRVVLVGVHMVALQESGAPRERMLMVAADETKEVNPTTELPAMAPAAPAVPVAQPNREEPPRGGLSQAWIAAAGAATLALLAATVWSWVDTANDHANFESEGCDRVGTPSCKTDASTGQGAEVRTIALATGTGVAALGTAALGLFVVRPRTPRQPGVSVGFSGTGGSMRVAF